MSDDLSRYVEIRDEETLNAVTRHWADLLGLKDWDIESGFAPHFDMDGSALGEISSFGPKRAARIAILRPEERLKKLEADDGKRFYPRESIEQTIVHELLHLHFNECGVKCVDADDPAYLPGERAIHALTMAFTSLHSYFNARALTVECIELTPEQRAGLTAPNVHSIGEAE
jgi:hypothetical protein